MSGYMQEIKAEAHIETLAHTLAQELGHEWEDLTPLEQAHYRVEARRLSR